MQRLENVEYQGINLYTVWIGCMLISLLRMDGKKTKCQNAQTMHIVCFIVCFYKAAVST